MDGILRLPWLWCRGSFAWLWYDLSRWLETCHADQVISNKKEHATKHALVLTHQGLNYFHITL